MDIEELIYLIKNSSKTEFPETLEYIIDSVDDVSDLCAYIGLSESDIDDILRGGEISSLKVRDVKKKSITYLKKQ